MPRPSFAWRAYRLVLDQDRLPAGKDSDRAGDSVPRGNVVGAIV